MTSSSLEQKYQQTLAENAALQSRLQEAERQLDWFKRQLFGRKSERLLAIDPAVQQSLLSSMEDLPAPPPPEQDEEASPAKTPRRKARQNAVNDSGLRFDDSVPVKVIEVAPDLPDGVSLDDVDVIATRSTFRLAQRRASYEVLEYRCPVFKVRRMPSSSSGWRRRNSSNTAIDRNPGAASSKGTTSSSKRPASGSGLRRVRGAAVCDGSRGSFSRR